MNEPIIEQAIAEARFMSQNAAEREAYWMRKMALMDAASRLETAKRQGLEKGTAKGLAKGRVEGAKEKSLQIAIDMLREGLPFEMVVKLTGCTQVEVEQWMNEHKDC